MADKKEAAAPEQEFFESILRGIWVFLKWVFSLRLPKSERKSKVESTKFQELRALAQSWQQVEAHLNTPATYALAVSEADKIFDAALQIKGSPGSTMGERLKNVETVFDKTLYQRIWDAHKLRNTLAHEVGSAVTEIQAREAIASFREGLRHLGVS